MSFMPDPTPVHIKFARTWLKNYPALSEHTEFSQDMVISQLSMLVRNVEHSMAKDEPVLWKDWRDVAKLQSQKVAELEQTLRTLEGTKDGI